MRAMSDAGAGVGIMKRTLAFCVPKYVVRNVLVVQPIKIAPIDREPIYIPTVEEMQALHGALETRNNSKDGLSRPCLAPAPIDDPDGIARWTPPWRDAGAALVKHRSEDPDDRGQA